MENKQIKKQNLQAQIESLLNKYKMEIIAMASFGTGAEFEKIQNVKQNLKNESLTAQKQAEDYKQQIIALLQNLTEIE